MITTAPVLTTVHDFVAVTGQVGAPVPTGNVTIDWFTNNECTGEPASNSGNIALGAGGTVDATGFAQGPLPADSHFGFMAHYLGDGVYLPSNGACEPLSTSSKLGSATVTQVHDVDHAVIISFEDGAFVHDRVVVTGQPNQPVPTGNVNIDWFTNETCTGTPAANSGHLALGADGTLDATGFVQGPLDANVGYSFKARYEGNALYDSSVGACEPLTGVAGETTPPKTAPPTDGIGSSTTPTSNDGLPALLLILAVIGLGAIFLTPARARARR